MKHDLTPRERLLTVLQGKIPDMVPVCPYLDEYYPREYLGKTKINMVDDLIEIACDFGFDLMLRTVGLVPRSMPDSPQLLYTGSDTHWLESITIGNPDENEAKKWKVETKREVISDDGKVIRVTNSISTPGGVLHEITIVTEIRPNYFFATKEEPLIKGRRDLEIYRSYFPRSLNYSDSLLKYAKDRIGEGGIILPTAPGGPFNSAEYLCGMERLLVAPLTEPEFYHELMLTCLEIDLPIARMLAQAGPDLIRVNGNIANGRLIGPDYFRRYILPYEKKYISAIQELGVPVLYHNCGYSNSLLECYADMGTIALESLSPPPVGDVDLAEAKKRIGNQVVLVGNLDQVHFLRKETDQRKVAEVVKQTVAAGAPGGRFILSTTDQLYDDTPEENLRTMVNTAREVGRY